MRISSWSSDVCSSYLVERSALDIAVERDGDDHLLALDQILVIDAVGGRGHDRPARRGEFGAHRDQFLAHHTIELDAIGEDRKQFLNFSSQNLEFVRSEEPTSELKSLMRNSYAVF